MELKIYENPDHTFYAIKDDSDNSFNINDSGGFIRESDDMDNDDLLLWAEITGIIDDDEYYLENEELDYEELRQAKRNREEVDTESYPGGRAFLICFGDYIIPGEIAVDMIEGWQPGDNGIYFIAHNYQALVKLQQHMEKSGKKINFKINKTIEQRGINV